MKNIFIVLGIVSIVFLTACSGAGTEKNKGDSTNSSNGNLSADSVITLKIGHVLDEKSNYHQGVVKFKELVEKKTDGQVVLELFPNGTLGGERDMIEGLGIGSVDLVLTATATLSGFSPEVNVIDLPFLFRDFNHAHKVLDGEIGDDLRKKVEDAAGVKTLAWMESGFRNIATKDKEVTKPEDMKGIKIRSIENDIHMDAYQAMGALPTPMAFTELFTALQQGVLDAQDNPIPVMASSNLDEVQRNITMTRHFYNASLVLMSNKKYESLTPEQQEAIEEAALEAATYERQVTGEMENQYIEEMKQNGVEIIEDPNVNLFIEAIQPIYEKYEPRFGKDLIEKIQNIK